MLFKTYFYFPMSPLCDTISNNSNVPGALNFCQFFFDTVYIKIYNNSQDGTNIRRYILSSQLNTTYNRSVRWWIVKKYPYICVEQYIFLLLTIDSLYPCSFYYIPVWRNSVISWINEATRRILDREHKLWLVDIARSGEKSNGRIIYQLWKSDFVMLAIRWSYSLYQHNWF